MELYLNSLNFKYFLKRGISQLTEVKTYVYLLTDSDHLTDISCGYIKEQTLGKNQSLLVHLLSLSEC